jgi:uncharacterized protein
MQEKVEFKSGKETLRGSLFIPNGKGPFPGVVFYHGRGSNRGNYLQMGRSLIKNGIASLAFDFGGCGKSDGVFKNQTHRMGIKDAEAGLKFILSQNVDKKRIGLLGSSFGGYCAAMLTKNHHYLKSIILRVPSSYDDSMLDSTVSAASEENFFGNKKNWIFSSSYKSISEFKGSLLVVESENDEIIFPEAVEKYFQDAVKSTNKKFVIQKNAKHSIHNNPVAKKEFNKLVKLWFSETL